MNILFLCHRVPFPPAGGAKIRAFHLIRHLAQQGHRLTVASLARNVVELREAGGLADYCEKALLEVVPNGLAWLQMVTSLPTSSPSSFGYFHSSRLMRRLRDELARNRYDLVFVHCSSMAPYVESLRGPAKILDYCDIDSQKWREYVGHQKFPISAGYWLEAIKLERRERILSRSFDLCTCATRAEVESLRQLGVTTRTDWFPNGVDTDFFAPGPEAYDPNFISFIGRMDYYPNQQAVMNFVRDVFPELRRLRPAIRFAIVGAEPSAEVRRLARIPGVTVTGSVPDVRPFVQRSALTVVPLEIARGTQNKILESMAMGVPVITSQCAADGVDALRQQHLLVASGVEEWVTAIRTVLDDPHQRQHLGSAGRDRMLSHHSWQAAMRRVDGLINTVMPQRQHAA